MREIRSFGSIDEVIELPNLTNIQIKSFDQFLQRDKAAALREDIGLQAAFKEVFPSD